MSNKSMELDTIFNDCQSSRSPVKIKIDTEDEMCLFKLGLLFSLGKKIHIENEDMVKEKILLEQKKGKLKTYYMSSFYWAMNNKSYQFQSSPLEGNIFLICPVANATEDQKKKLFDIVNDYSSHGFKVYYPARDTNQSPYENNIYTGGYNINCINATAIGSSSKIIIFYDRQSRGLFFDLGVLYVHKKKNPNIEIEVINRETLNHSIYSDRIVLNFIY